MSKRNTKIIFSGVNINGNIQCIERLKITATKHDGLNFDSFKLIGETNAKPQNSGKCILFYCSPEYYLSQKLSVDNLTIEPLKPEELLIEWNEETEKTLSFYLSHINDSVLVDIEQCLIHFRQLTKKVNHKFDLHLKNKSNEIGNVEAGNDPIELNVVQNEIAKSFELMKLHEHYEIQETYEEIVSAADWLIQNVAVSFDSRMKYLTESCKSELKNQFTRLSSIEENNKNLNEKLIDVESHQDKSLLHIKQLQEEIENYSKEKIHLGGDKKNLEMKVTAYKEENNISLQQIYKLQEELEVAISQKIIFEKAQQKLEVQNFELADKSKLALSQIQQLTEELKGIMKQRTEFKDSNKNLKAEKLDLECENEIAVLKIKQLTEEVKGILNQRTEFEDSNEKLKAEKSDLKCENEIAVLQIQQLTEEVKGILNQRTEFEDSNKNLKTEKLDLECENEIAVLQIQQLQEELEFYFIKYQCFSQWKPQAQIKDKRFEQSLKLSRLISA